jgi:hypothetical protein
MTGLAEQVADSNPSLDRGSVSDILRMYASLYLKYHTDSDCPISEIADGLVSAAKEHLGKSTDSEIIDWTLIKRSMLEILGSDKVLGLTAKAHELNFENDQRLCPDSCRIISELRPIFTSNPSKEPAALVVHHVMKIGYHTDSNEIKRFFVTLDGRDIKYLQALLKRAQEKENSLRRLAKKTGVPLFETAGDAC